MPSVELPFFLYKQKYLKYKQKYIESKSKNSSTFGESVFYCIGIECEFQIVFDVSNCNHLRNFKKKPIFLPVSPVITQFKDITINTDDTDILTITDSGLEQIKLNYTDQLINIIIFVFTYRYASNICGTLDDYFKYIENIGLFYDKEYFNNIITFIKEKDHGGTFINDLKSKYTGLAKIQEINNIDEISGIISDLESVFSFSVFQQLKSFNRIDIPIGEYDTAEENPSKYEIRNLYCNRTISESIKEIHDRKHSIFEAVKSLHKKYSENIKLVDNITSYPFYINTECSPYSLTQHSEPEEIDIGSYHLNITLPHQKSDSIDSLRKRHIKLMKCLQLLEPLFLAVFTNVKFNSFYDNHTYNENSLRLLESKFNNFLATPNLDEFYTNPQLHSDKRYYRSGLLKNLNEKIKFNKYTNTPSGADFRYNPALSKSPDIINNLYINVTEYINKALMVKNVPDIDSTSFYFKPTEENKNFTVEEIKQKFNSDTESILESLNKYIKALKKEQYDYNYIELINRVYHALNDLNEEQQKPDNFFGFEFRFFDLFSDEYLNEIIHFVFFLAQMIDDCELTLDVQPLDVLNNDTVLNFIVNILKEGWNCPVEQSYKDILISNLKLEKFGLGDCENCYDFLNKIYSTLLEKYNLQPANTFEISTNLRHVTSQEIIKSLSKNLKNINRNSFNLSLDLQLKNDSAIKEIVELVSEHLKNIDKSDETKFINESNNKLNELNISEKVKINWTIIEEDLRDIIAYVFDKK